MAQLNLTSSITHTLSNKTMQVKFSAVSNIAFNLT